MRMTRIAIAAVVLLAACDSPLVTDPTASIDAGTALGTPRGIELGVNGAYRSLQQGVGYITRDLVAYPDLYADNLDFTGTFQTDREVALRAVPASNGNVRDLWTIAYIGINRANAVLDAIPNVSALSDTERDTYTADALFIRALHYLRLVRWFGDVPLVLTAGGGVGPEAQVSRNTQAEVYAQIIDDLETALPLAPTARRAGMATRGAVNALLARVYLDNGQNALARDRAAAVIGDPLYDLTASFGDVFQTKHSSESILEFPFSITNSNSLAFWFFPQALGGRWGMSPTAALYALYEANDARRDASIRLSGSSRYIYKYWRIAAGDDNMVELRLAEMYLIRAEANARLNAAADVVRADVDVVRQRAGVSPLPATVDTQQELLDAILLERRLELAFEGHRFFDLRRFGVAPQVLNIAPDRLLFPIPQAERDVNPNLTQNPGY